MEVRQLEAFLAVADQLHFGRAAAILHLAPSPLSRAIRSLENELGVPLFERNTRSVTLTSAGEAFRGPAADVIAATQKAAESIDAAVSGELGTVRVEFSGIASHAVVAGLARGIRIKHPRIALELSSQPFSRPSMKRLLTEETDIILGRWDYIPSGVESHDIRPDPLVVAMPARHRLASASEVSFDEIRGEPFVSLPYERGAVSTERLWRLGHAHGYVVDIVQFAPDTPSCIALVGAELGSHLTMASVGERLSNPDVAFVPLSAADAALVPPVQLRAAWKIPIENPAIETAVAMLLQLAS